MNPGDIQENEWEAIKEHVAPGIASMEQYRAAVARGELRAVGIARGDDRSQANVSRLATELSNLHFSVYQDALRKAGEFRVNLADERLESRFGPKYSAITKPMYNDLRLIQARWNTSDYFMSLRSDSAKANRIADFHTHLLCARPFEIGTERVAKIIMDSQSEHLLGFRASHYIATDVYNGLVKSVTDENLDASRDVMRQLILTAHDARSLEIDNERIRSLQQNIAQESERSNDRQNDREIERG